MSTYWGSWADNPSGAGHHTFDCILPPLEETKVDWYRENISSATDDQVLVVY